jgi:hypothetical protein
MSLYTYNVEQSIGDKFKKVSKKYLYTAAIGVAGSILLRDVNMSEQGSLLGMQLPLPLFVGLGVGLALLLLT